jgi:Xaa-Pro dipeptidase
MPLRDSYADHIQTLDRRYGEILRTLAAAGSEYEGLVFHAGSEILYHADDQPVPFRPVPHFARWAPLKGSDHLLVFEPGRKPRLLQVVPRDYWYEAPAAVEHPYPEVLEVEQFESVDDAIDELGVKKGHAFVGYDLEVAEELGIPDEAVEAGALMARLDWDRGLKTPYEVECLRQAVAQAAIGHATARAGAELGHPERAIHAGYLAATGQLENDAPYTNIIAWNANAAVLHYQSKDRVVPTERRNFLIDAGATMHGYASDITRTYPGEQAHPLFVEIVDRMDTMQRELVAGVRPGRSYVELHEECHRGVAAILCELGILKVDAEQAYSRSLTDPFFPHGLGHHLGLQVHDVGGRQKAPEGGVVDPPARHAFLRTTREMAVGQVLTIEPGLYFIPLLLDPHRGGKDAASFDWKLIDQLIPCGGVRIEDDILCTEDGFEDLSRDQIPGHRD